MNMEDLVKRYGFDLARQKKHKVYKHPDGRTFVLPSTPSDWRSSHNQLSDFSRLMGLSKKELLGLERKERKEVVVEDKPVLLHPPELVLSVEEKINEAPIAYSKSDLKKLKRWEKIYRLQQEKLSKRKRELEDHLIVTQGVFKQLVLEGNYSTTDFYTAWKVVLQRAGWNPVSCGLVINDWTDLFLIYQVGKFYLDVHTGIARLETQWMWEDFKFEVVGPI